MIRLGANAAVSSPTGCQGSQKPNTAACLNTASARPHLHPPPSNERARLECVAHGIDMCRWPLLLLNDRANGVHEKGVPGCGNTGRFLLLNLTSTHASACIAVFFCSQRRSTRPKCANFSSSGGEQPHVERKRQKTGIKFRKQYLTLSATTSFLASSSGTFYRSVYSIVRNLHDFLRPCVHGTLAAIARIPCRRTELKPKKGHTQGGAAGNRATPTV